jgi:hypothetical protein
MGGEGAAGRGREEAGREAGGAGKGSEKAAGDAREGGGVLELKELRQQVERDAERTRKAERRLQASPQGG